MPGAEHFDSVVLVLQAVQERGLELPIVFNRTAVMVPTGVNEATGMDHARRKLGLSAHEVVGIGDSLVPPLRE